VPWKSDINATFLLMRPKLQVDFSLISNVNDGILKQIFVVFKNMFVMFLDNDLMIYEIVNNYIKHICCLILSLSL
jgi:hypothetical protein